MGAFDTFVVNCPNCGDQMVIQTKLFENEMTNICPGATLSNPVTGEVDDFMIITKDGCEKCGHTPGLIFIGGEFKTAVSPKYAENIFKRSYMVINEHPWGTYEVTEIDDKRFTTRW